MIETAAAYVIIQYLLQGLRTLIPIIASKLGESRARKEKVNAQFKKLCYSMSHISGFLDDFETKQLTETSIRNWLDDLKEAAYDLDDLFDRINTLIMIQSYATFDKTMMTRIEEISMTLENIDDMGKKLNLVVGKSSSKSSHTNRLPTTPYFAGDEFAVYGREEEKQSMIKMLCDSNNDGAGGISVISIVGMGSIGKTTLAQLVYNDTSVKGKFDVRAWVYVSQEFDVVSIIKSIHEEIMGTTSTSNLLGTLQQGLREALARKKFLIVLDDVWNRDHLAWDSLRTSLDTGVPGSRIIITTRDETVASSVGSRHLIHRMKLVTNGDCLKILTHHAQMTLKDNDALSLVEKCKGVPLAAKVIGLSLHSNESSMGKTTLERAWDQAKEKYILPILQSSYYDLNTHLKNLFAYCTLFPKGYEFDKNDLVYLWMGEGFLENHHKSQSKEETGIEYFDELLSRFFSNM